MYPKIFADYFRGFERSSEVFVAMAFSREAEPHWRHIFSPAIRSLRLRPFRVRDSHISDSILTDILRAIGRARLLLVDLSFQKTEKRPPGPNPNVVYELGLAHALGQSNVGSGLAIPDPWPNNPVELTAHSVRFFGYFLHFLLWATAHRER